MSGVRLQNRCFNKEVAICPTHTLINPSFIGDSRDKDLGPRFIAEEERIRREALYKPTDPEKLLEWQRQGHRERLLWLLRNNAKGRRSLTIQQMADEIGCSLQFAEEIRNEEVARTSLNRRKHVRTTGVRSQNRVQSA